MSRPRLLLGGLLILVVGGFVLWLQVGLLYALASLGYGGLGLQSHLSAAADGLQSGEYDQARAEYEAAQVAIGQLDRSIGVGQVDLVGRIPGLDVAVTNWQLSVSAAGDVTDSTGEVLSLYGDLSGKGGGAEDLQRRSDRPRAPGGPARSGSRWSVASSMPRRRR